MKMIDYIENFANHLKEALEIAKNSIIREFGLAGFEKVFEKITYKKNPFSELARISKVLKI